MKKLALLILSFAFALSSSQVSANQGYVFEDVSESEKMYLLAATVRTYGEYGSNRPFQILHPDRRTFYFSLEKCKGENCSEAQKLFLESAHRFADEYNQVLDDNGLSDDLKITILNHPQEGAYPIYLSNSIHLKKFTFDCTLEGHLESPYLSDQCSVLMRIIKNVDKRISSFLLTFADLGVTKQARYLGCISYVGKTISEDFNLCEIEKKAIVFIHRYLEYGMKESEVLKFFNQHWDDLEINT